MKFKPITNAMMLAGCVLAAGSAAAVEIPREFLAMVQEAMPREVADSKVIADLMNPVIGPQLSKNFDIRNASRGLRDKLSPTPNCYLATRPDGDPDNPLTECTYRRGEPNGEGGAAMMKVDLGTGKLKYLNRDRDPDLSKETDARLTPEQAMSGALQLAGFLGIPTDEVAKDFMTASDQMATGSTPDNPKPEFMIRSGVQVLLPRCMPVRGEVINDCVPVFDSGLSTVMTDLGPSWMNGRWTDFVLGGAQEIVAPDMLVMDTATVLAEQMQVGTVAGLKIFIAYVQQQEFSRRNGSEQCPPPQGDEEKVGVPAVQTGQHYLPAVVVYAEPQAPAEGQATTKETYSTGGLQYAIPLVKPTECGDLGAPQA